MEFELLTLLLLLLLLPISAFAAPVANPEPQAAASAPTKPFTLTVAHNHDTALNGQSINAAGLAFYMGLASPSAFCPSPPVPANECPTGTETVFSGLLSMDVEVPGGQLAYVGPDGALGYTQAHSTSIPPGSFTQGFCWTPLHTNSVLGQRGVLDFMAPGAISGGFLACPDVPVFVPGATFRIFAQVPGFKEKNCVNLGTLRTTEFKLAEFAAWQYT